MSGETLRQEVGGQSPLRQQAEKLAAGNNGTLGLSRDQAVAKLAEHGIMPPGASMDAAAERALAQTRAILARDDLTPEYRAMLEKSIETVSARWKSRGAP